MQTSKVLKVIDRFKLFNMYKCSEVCLTQMLSLTSNRLAEALREAVSQNILNKKNDPITPRIILDYDSGPRKSKSWN